MAKAVPTREPKEERIGNLTAIFAELDFTTYETGGCPFNPRNYGEGRRIVLANIPSQQGKHFAYDIDNQRIKVYAITTGTESANGADISTLLSVKAVFYLE